MDLNPATDTERVNRSVAKIKEWLTVCKCETGHTQGLEEFEPHVSPKHKLPKRLISIVNDTCYVIEADGLVYAPRYVAVSYCWGPQGSVFKTTQSTLMEEGILVDDFPKTLKDVIKVVQGIGIRYLWIDAICIVQDNDEWACEAKKMGDTYANAYLVISAIASPTVDSGLYIETQNFSEEDKEYVHLIMRSCRSMPQKHWDSRISDRFPLLCRAWAFQERVLSRRIVHFTMLELFWECQEDRWCECTVHDFSGKRNTMSSAVRACVDNPNSADAQFVWRECVQSYSKRALTHPEDRPIAISGVASLLRGEHCYKDLYCEGLWADAMPWDLLWFCDQSSTLAVTKIRKPTYSWISVDSGTEWPKMSHEREDSLQNLVKKTFFARHEGGAQVQNSVNLTKSAKCTPLDTKLGIELTTTIVPVDLKWKTRPRDCQQALQTHWSVTHKNGIFTRKKLLFYPDVDLARERNKTKTKWINFYNYVIQKLCYIWAVMSQYHLIMASNGYLPYGEVLLQDKTLVFNSMEDTHTSQTESEAGAGVVMTHEAIPECDKDYSYYYVEVVGIENDKGVWEAGLVVRPVEGLANTYERVGVAGHLPCQFEPGTLFAEGGHEHKFLLI